MRFKYVCSDCGKEYITDEIMYQCPECSKLNDGISFPKGNLIVKLDKEVLKKAKEKEQQEYESKYGYSGEKLENYSERYRIAYDFYSALSPDIAVDALKASPSMKYYLGNMYDRLLSSLQSKKKEQKFYF